MKKGTIHIGTSGWHYKHWKGRFYPEGTKDKEQFHYYCTRFSTVEINNSFYKLPTQQTFANWYQATPAGFIFSVKVSRFITHLKKLTPDPKSLHNFLGHADALEEKLGPLLFQLPPNWNVNTERLASYLASLPKGYCYTFEFRDHSWYIPEVYQLLSQYGCAFCIYHLQHHLSPIELTADFVYIRLHGPGNKYQGCYKDAELQEWANYCRSWQRAGKDVYIYFDNDEAGYAAFNAMRIKELIDR